VTAEDFNQYCFRLLSDLEEDFGRLPRRKAYPLIFVISVVLWSLIGGGIGVILSKAGMP
jgi:hypothetical protein